MGDGPAGEAACEGPSAAEALRVVAAAAWHVVRQRRFSEFPRVLSFLESVAEAAPELVPFQHLAKLRLGLQAKIVMNMLQEDQRPGKIYQALDTFFSEKETPLRHSEVTAHDLEMVQVAQENFRILILTLLRDCTQKEAYVQKYLEADYGEGFAKVLEKLFRDYLCQLEHVLPEPQFETLLESARIQPPNQFPPPSAAILNQYFRAAGYQWAGCDEPPPSPPHPSCAPHQRADEGRPTSPLSPQPGRSRNKDSAASIPEGDSHQQPSETPDDLVPDSENERSPSPFQVD